MSNRHAFQNIAKDFDDMMTAHESDSERSISLPTSVTRNSLSQALQNVNLSPVSTPDTPDQGSSVSNVESDVRMMEKMSILMDREAERSSLNIALYVKYFASPLRLYIKTLLQSMPMDMRVAHASAIRISERVKMDLVGEWNSNDTFGLKILVKMYRLFKNVMPLVNGHTEYMKYFDPSFGTKLLEHERAMIEPVTYFLLNNVLNPGAALHPNGQVSLESDMHQWYDNFMINRTEDLEEVGLTIDEAKVRLRKKLAFDLNNFAATVFKKPLRFKYNDFGTGEVKEDIMQPEELIQQLHQKFMGSPGAMILGEQMSYWLLNDDPAPALMRGGKHKKSQQKITQKKSRTNTKK